MSQSADRRRHVSTVVQTAAVAALVLISVARWSGDDGATRPNAATIGMTPSGLLAGQDTTGFARATRVRPFVFPDDHGPHLQFQTEWWYFTGNLATVDTPPRHFGFQVTFFRFALAPQDRSNDGSNDGTDDRRGDEPGESPWRSRQTYMAHVAITDTESGRLISDEQFSRDALGLAGAQAAPFRVWLGSWEAISLDTSFLPIALSADAGEFGVHLGLSEGKPGILQGDAGLSRKSAEPGNASYYYSYTRLPAAGEVRVGPDRFRVTGEAWLDREWSTSALAPGTAGWDWFALQLNDGSELMFYRLRGNDGSTGEHSGGVLVGADGNPVRLSATDVHLTVERNWKSPHTGVSYPVGWRLRSPAHGLDLAVTPRIDDQELNLSVIYWEGAVQATGSRHGRPVLGNGYLELAGYAR